jgi:hypothetical protein
LQPQLNKAVRERETRSKGDINPKDFVLYRADDFEQVHAQPARID